jgi:hypothetical protein
MTETVCPTPQICEICGICGFNFGIGLNRDTTAFDDGKGSGWKRHEQFAIRRDQDVFGN